MCWSYNPKERPTFKQIVTMLKKDPKFITDNIDFDEFVEYTELIGDSYYVKEEEEDDDDEKQQQQKQKKKKMLKQQPQNLQERTVNKVSEIIKEETNKAIQQKIETQTNKNIFHDLTNYEQKEIISKEEFAKTIKIVDKATGQSFAARISNIDMNQFSEEEINSISQEMHVISQLKHPSVLKVIGFSPFNFKKEPKPVIITEVPSRKTLKEIIEINKNGIHLTDWNSTKKLICIYGIASAMKYLHSHDIIHRQLMPKNVLISHKFHPEICNFGPCSHLINLTSMASQSSSRVQCIHVYSAPEVLNFEECTKASDVYSFAFIVYEIITNEKPLNDLKDFARIYKDVVDGEKRPLLKKSVPFYYRNLIEMCWSQDPRKRPSFDEIVDMLENDPEFTKYDVNQNEYQEYIKMIYDGKKEKHNVS